MVLYLLEDSSATIGIRNHKFFGFGMRVKFRQRTFNMKSSHWKTQVGKCLIFNCKHIDQNFGLYLCTSGDFWHVSNNHVVVHRGSLQSFFNRKLCSTWTITLGLPENLETHEWLGKYLVFIFIFIIITINYFLQFDQSVCMCVNERGVFFFL